MISATFGKPLHCLSFLSTMFAEWYLLQAREAASKLEVLLIALGVGKEYHQRKDLLSRRLPILVI